MFAEKGYRETSVDEIAARVGIAKGTVYLHFPGKEELVSAILEQMMESYLQAVNEVVALSATPRNKLEKILRVLYGDFYHRRAQLFSSMYNNVDFRRLFENKQCRTNEVWEQLIAVITQVIEEGKALGEFSSAIPTKVMVSVFFNLQSPHSSDRLGVGTEIAIDEFVKYLSMLFFQGITAPNLE